MLRLRPTRFVDVCKRLGPQLNQQVAGLCCRRCRLYICRCWQHLGSQCSGWLLLRRRAIGFHNRCCCWCLRCSAGHCKLALTLLTLLPLLRHNQVLQQQLRKLAVVRCQCRAQRIQARHIESAHIQQQLLLLPLLVACLWLL